MGTLTEIETAVGQLPTTQQKQLFAFLAARLGRRGGTRPGARRGLKAATYPPLDGLPADLSIGTKERVRARVQKHHAADR